MHSLIEFFFCSCVNFSASPPPLQSIRKLGPNLSLSIPFRFWHLRGKKWPNWRAKAAGKEVQASHETTEHPKNVCTWLREIYSCSCLTVCLALPGSCLARNTYCFRVLCRMRVSIMRLNSFENVPKRQPFWKQGRQKLVNNLTLSKHVPDLFGWLSRLDWHPGAFTCALLPTFNGPTTPS